MSSSSDDLNSRNSFSDVAVLPGGAMRPQTSPPGAGSPPVGTRITPVAHSSAASSAAVIMQVEGGTPAPVMNAPPMPPISDPSLLPQKPVPVPESRVNALPPGVPPVQAPVSQASIAPSPPTFPPLSTPSLAARLQTSEAKPVKATLAAKVGGSAIDPERQKLKLGEVEAIAARLLAAGRASSVARSAVLASLPPQGANPVVDALRAALSREAAAEAVAKSPSGESASTVSRTVVPLPTARTPAAASAPALASFTIAPATQPVGPGIASAPLAESVSRPSAMSLSERTATPLQSAVRTPIAALPPRHELPIQLPRLTQSRMPPTGRSGGHLGSVLVGLALAGALGSLVYIMLGPKELGNRRSEVKQMVRDLAALERKGEEQAAKVPQPAAPPVAETPAGPPQSPPVALAPPVPPASVEPRRIEPRVEAQPERPPAVMEKPPREAGRDAAIVASVIGPRIETPAAPRETAVLPPSPGTDDDVQAVERMTLDIQDGNRLMRSGDVESAKRRYFQAARAGSAEAAAALARTYDPTHLAALERANVKPDPREALRWYKVAVERGLSVFGEQVARLEAELGGTEAPRGGMKPLSATVEPLARRP